MDEAAQATEPESLIPLGSVRSSESDGRMMLVGDHRQLFPCVKSPVGLKFGLHSSLMNRMCAIPGIVMKVLTEQHRMHPNIIVFQSEFFDNEALVDSFRAKKSKRCAWFLREESSEGVAFIHVDAYEQRMGRSYSNVDQIKAILYIIRLLFDGHDVNCSDIGIITPYDAQVDELKKRRRDSNLHCIESASVDGFSGQGKDVIFLSNPTYN